VPVSRDKLPTRIELLPAKIRYAVRRGDDNPPADQGRGTHKSAGTDIEEQLSRRTIGVVYIGGKVVQIGASRAEGKIADPEFLRRGLLRIVSRRTRHAQIDRVQCPSTVRAWHRATALG